MDTFRNRWKFSLDFRDGNRNMYGKRTRVRIRLEHYGLTCDFESVSMINGGSLDIGAHVPKNLTRYMKQDDNAKKKF